MNLVRIYQELSGCFGKQKWWPTQSKNPEFEIIIGAILTQQTKWSNVEKAIINLKMKNLLNPRNLINSRLNEIESLIKMTGFYRQKAGRIKYFSEYLVKNYNGSLDNFFNKSTEEIRKELLSLNGIGKETADSILLYAAKKLIFPVDAYTKRMCKRLGFKESEYEEIRMLFENSLPRNLEIYNEMHALIVKLGKSYCKIKPVCYECPLKDYCLKI
jgi:endonuclease-3 related protein